MPPSPFIPPAPCTGPCWIPAMLFILFSMATQPGPSFFLRHPMIRWWWPDGQISRMVPRLSVAWDWVEIMWWYPTNPNCLGIKHCDQLHYDDWIFDSSDHSLLWVWLPDCSHAVCWSGKGMGGHHRTPWPGPGWETDPTLSRGRPFLQTSPPKCCGQFNSDYPGSQAPLWGSSPSPLRWSDCRSYNSLSEVWAIDSQQSSLQDFGGD